MYQIMMDIDVLRFLSFENKKKLEGLNILTVEELASRFDVDDLRLENFKSYLGLEPEDFESLYLEVQAILPIIDSMNENLSCL